MKKRNTLRLRNGARFAVIAALVASLGAGPLVAVPTIASATTSEELQAQLDEAQAQLDSLYAQAEEASEAVNDTKVQIEELDGQIEETEGNIEVKQAELEEAQEALAGDVSASYKSGHVSLLALILGSNDIESFISNIYYANRVAEQEAEAIDEVKDLQEELANEKSALEEQKAEQSELLEQQEQQQAELEDAAAEAQDYVDGLSEEVREAIAAEEAAAQKAAEEAAAKAQAEAQAAAEAEAQAETEEQQQAEETTVEEEEETTSTETTTTTTTTTESTSTETTTTTTTTTTSSSSAAWRGTVISAACSMVGGTYSYGACDPSTRTFDCSGLVSYAYACAGYSIPHSSAALAAYCTKSLSQVQPGDIVWKSGHVGIYIGNGTVVEAFNPNHNPQIGYGTLSGYVSCGSPA